MKSFCLVLLLFLCFGLLLAEEGLPYERLKVQKVEVVVENDPALESKENKIAQRLKTASGGYFSQEDFDEDLKALAKEYDRIDPQLEIVNGQLFITLRLWVRPKIVSITWQGNREVSQEKLSKELAIYPGMVFDKQSFNKAFHKIRNSYIKKGFFEAELDYTVHREGPTNEVEIVIHIKEGRSGKIDAIVFHNLTKKEEDELLELIFTKSYNFFTSWLTQEGTHNPEVLHQDEMTILSYLQNEGYADAKVTTTIKPAKKGDAIIIDIDVDKGQKYHFSDVSISGNTIFSTEDLLKKLSVKDGDVYSPEKIRQSGRLLQNLYGSKGYIDVHVSYDTKLDPEKAIYAIAFTIHEGARYRVGLIKVFGNTRTDSAVVLHEIALTPGEIFDSTLLQKSEERLRNIGFFKNVNIYAVKSSKADTTGPRFRDVYVEVEENPTTANVHFFLTYNSTENLSGGVMATESNFNSKGLFTLFKTGMKGLRGGGEYVSANATVGKKLLNYSASWTKPYFMDTPWIVGFELARMRNEYASQDYTIRSNNVSVFGHYPINAFLKAGWQYRLNHSFIKLNSRAHGNSKLLDESKNGGLISAIGPQLSYDSTDNPITPRRGLRSTLTAEYAGLGGDHQFFKVS